MGHKKVVCFYYFNKTSVSLLKRIVTFPDEEKPDIKSAFEKMKPRTEPSTKQNVSKSPEKNRKQVSVMDFFGSAEIHRKESKTSATASNKRKAVCCALFLNFKHSVDL